jgi:hypothetical protein
MKKYLLVLLWATWLLSISCKKKDCCVFPPVKDFILADKDGTEWNADPSKSNILGDTTTITGSLTTGNLEEVLEMKLIISDVGFYPLKNNHGGYVVKKNGTIIKKYALSPTHLNTVSIIFINGKDQIVQGFFDVKFIKTYDSQPGAKTDSVSFLDGKFKVALHN